MPTTLVIGDLEATRLTCELLRQEGHRTVHLAAPTDREIADSLSPALSSVVVIVHSDVKALRYVLVVEHLRPGIRLVTTVFDRTVADQLQVIPHCTVTSPANISAPAIVAACLSQTALAVIGAPGDRRVLRRGKGEPGRPAIVTTPWRDERQGFLSRLQRWAPRWVGGATGLMLGGLLGLLGVLLCDWFLAAGVLHESPLRALYAATRVVAGVGPAEADAEDVPGWYLLVSVLLMLATILFTGTFVAGVVDWLQSSRTLGLIGRRTLPRGGHVVVAGLGQVGFRVCLLLKELRIPVVAVERDAGAENVRLARSAKIPVLIGHAEDRAVMRRVNLSRARALAALGSEDLDNVKIAISALAEVPTVRIVLRAGEDDVIAETRSLFRIGRVVDVSAMTALTATLALTGRPATAAFVENGDVHVWTETGDVHGTRPSRCECRLTG